MTDKRIRCAIYTRKSTEEGLEKEFNTLDAQREAGEAYVKSQMHEGWQVIPTMYDDGGFTGGNMNRPALQQLIADMKAGKINIIVVYKVDRLTRSLADFAKLVEMLDEYGVSFVSVTQQFNTSTSMGRLTLNVLLSFAQFEREVIGERVRDKVAASKKKGMWMGGCPPLGYNADERKLVINKTEAKIVRRVFELYLQNKSASTALAELNDAGIKNKTWKTKKGRLMGGQKFSRTIIYRILKEPLYLGKIRHKDNLYEGLHDAIISEDVWNRAQELIASQTVARTKILTESGTILRGKCVDPEGRKYTTTYSVKNKHTHHRYYLNKHTNHRIRGDNLEQVVFDAVAHVCLKPENMKLCLNGEYALLSEEEGTYRLQNLWTNWPTMSEKARHKIAQAMIDKITILPDSTTIRIKYEALNQLLKNYKVLPIEKSTLPELVNEPSVILDDDRLEITLNIIFKVQGRTQQSFTPEGKAFETFKTVSYNMTLVNALAKGHKWDQLIRQKNYTPEKIANEYGVSKGYVSSMLRLTLLCPEIVESILSGKQPAHLQLKDLARPFPYDWEAQKRQFSY